MNLAIQLQDQVWFLALKCYRKTLMINVLLV